MKPIWERLSARVLVSCDLCGSSDTVQLAATDLYDSGLPTVLCTGCGLIYTSPRMPEEAYKSFYESEYGRQFQKAGDELSRAYLDVRGDFYYAEERWKRYKAYLSDDDTFLEIGAGIGAFCGLLKENLDGIAVTAIEPDELAASFARKNLGINVIQEDLEAFSTKAELFTHIAFFHVLEHVYSPSAFLSRISSLLKENGRIFVEVPNAAGPWQSINFLHPAHLYQFTPTTLCAVLEKAGFRIDDVKVWDEEPLPISMSIVASKHQARLKGHSPLTIAAKDEICVAFQKRLKNSRRDILAAKLKTFLAQRISPQLSTKVRRIMKGKPSPRVTNTRT